MVLDEQKDYYRQILIQLPSHHPVLHKLYQKCRLNLQHEQTHQKHNKLFLLGHLLSYTLS